MLKTNRERLVMQSALGIISFPRISLKNPYLVDSSGNAHILPGTGGITYNVLVGDSALEFAGDHVEPGVSIMLPRSETDTGSGGGLSVLACIGNEAKVVSGEAAGAVGIVTGKHGGVEHVLVDFSRPAIEKLVIGDRIQIKAFGQGMTLGDYPGIHVMNIDPGLLDRLGIESRNGNIVVPVAHIIPASIMGSGLGSRHSHSGDYDIQMNDDLPPGKNGLSSLRIGDIIAIKDADCRFGRTIKTGAVTIGVVVHGSCVTNGHGPGVTVVMTTDRGQIVPKIKSAANIAGYLEIGRGRKTGKTTAGKSR